MSPPATGSWRTRTAVVVPRELAEDVLEEAEAMAATENEIRAAVREAPPLEAYEVRDVLGGLAERCSSPGRAEGCDARTREPAY